MKILIAGDWRWPIYEQAFSQALSELGHHVIPFSFSDYFAGRIGHYQSAIPFPGPALLRINKQLLKKASVEKPEVVFVWRGTHILPGTIKQLNRTGILTASYNNDDPFGSRTHGKVPWHHHLLWFWYLLSLNHYQHNFFYRQVNVDEALAMGALHAKVLKPYFIPWLHRPMVLPKVEASRFSCDVVFVGHYEPDDRVNHLRALVHSRLSVKLFGGRYWTPKVLGDLYSYFAPIVPTEGDNYAKALCGAKVCLAFLSKLNRDTYTRRCLEIPACGRVMLAERTDDLLGMFGEDKEACFFSSTEELVTKAKWLVENPNIADQIAQAGQRRVWADGHDVKSRVGEFLDAVNRNNSGPFK
ncbi:MAG: glycosyltransferase [Candidatus Methanoperedens sp.]|nr:glycosyltransferase [Candidatus Methanoperedens sp.]